MEEGAVAAFSSRYVAMWAMMGSKAVPPPPVRWKDVEMDVKF